MQLFCLQCRKLCSSTADSAAVQGHVARNHIWLKHSTRTTVLSARVLSVLVHSTACIQFDPCCSSEFVHATRQWANPRGFSHEGFGRVLFDLILVRSQIATKGFGSCQVLLLCWRWLDNSPSCPWSRPCARAAVKGPSVLVLGGSEDVAKGFVLIRMSLWHCFDCMIYNLLFIRQHT